MDISKYIQDKKFVKGSERNYIINEIYSFYDTEQEVILTKKKNWKNYIAFLKSIREPDSKKNQDRFRSSKKFIKKMKPSSVAFFLSHIKTKDLYYVLSVVKDKHHRNQSVGAYIKSLAFSK